MDGFGNFHLILNSFENKSAVLQAQSWTASPWRRPSPVQKLPTKCCWASCLLSGWNLWWAGSLSTSDKNIKPPPLFRRKSGRRGIFVLLMTFFFYRLTSDSTIYPSSKLFVQFCILQNGSHEKVEVSVRENIIILRLSKIQFIKWTWIARKLR